MCLYWFYSPLDIRQKVGSGKCGFKSCQLYLGVIFFGTIALHISKVSPSESFVEIQGRGLVMGFIIVVFSLEQQLV